jgi:hypothetical protein
MIRGRLNIQSGGWWVLQDFDPTDPFGTAYDDTNRPINYGARYGFSTDSDGIPTYGQIAGTRGPIGGWICLPGIGGGGRSMAQWAQVFPAKITTSGLSLKATAVNTGDGLGWYLATDLADVVVYTHDGSMPPVGTVGLIVKGTENGAQNALFFEGGGGAGVKTYKVTLNLTGGSYELQEYDRKGGATVGSPVSGCEELNLSPNVPANHWVHGITEADGVIRFVAPFGSC